MAKSTIKQYFDNYEWYEVFDLLEFIVKNEEFPGLKEDFIEDINKNLESERSGYRMIHDTITPIIDEESVKEIEKSLNQTELVGIHIKSALVNYSYRQNPDYRNSIKESISAVESACKLILSDKNKTLGDALTKLKKLNIDIPTSLADGFSKIYGYTNSENGIRHALSDIPDLKEEDARFMLIACSAFANYLISKAQRAKIL